MIMNLKGKKILVTGADGFIGSHLTETLVRAGHDVRAFVLYNSFSSWGWLDHSNTQITENLDIFMGDVRDPHGVKTAMQGVDVVLHLAALIAIPYSYHSPHSYVETNVSGTLNIVQAARELGVEKVVHTSTSETYGTAQYVPIDEAHSLQGQSPYSASKIGADQMAMSYYSSFETPVAIIRPFNTYGPRQSARAVIPTIITQLLNGQEEIKLGALSPTRDFNYIDDTVQGFIKVAESDKAVGEVINIGSGFEISIEDTAKAIADVLGTPLNITCDHERVRPEKSEVERLLASNAKALELLDWSPEHGGLDGFKRGLKKTADWFADPQNLSAYKADRYNV